MSDSGHSVTVHLARKWQGHQQNEDASPATAAALVVTIARGSVNTRDGGLKMPQTRRCRRLYGRQDKLMRPHVIAEDRLTINNPGQELKQNASIPEVRREEERAHAEAAAEQAWEPLPMVSVWRRRPRRVDSVVKPADDVENPT